MKCMEYSNLNHVNIIPQEDFEDLANEVFNVIASNLCRSLGPLGSSATIFDGAIVEATKDGYSILSKYSFMNRYKKMIYNLIKAPCTRMNNTVGDGTTTAIALTNALYNRYHKWKGVLDTMYRLPRQFTKAWDDVIEDLTKRINAKAEVINPEDYDTIYNLAYVTSNGNHEVSHTIAMTYKEVKSPSIKMKDSPTNKSYISYINGFEFPTNAIDNCYVRNQDLSATEEDVAVMIFDHTIETDTFNSVIVPVNEVMRAMSKKLIILAPAYDQYMCESVLGQYVNIEVQKYREINLILCQYRTGDLSKYQIQDLAVILRTKCLTQGMIKELSEAIKNSNIDSVIESMNDDTNPFFRYIGEAATALISCKNGTIFNVKDIENDQYYKDAVDRAQNELDDILAHTDYERQSFAAKVYEARSRVLQLKMNNYIYYIGADSTLQKQILHDSIEDVIKCLKSAIKYGVVPGCQLSIFKSCAEAINDIVGSEIATDLNSFKNIKFPDDLTDENKLKVHIIRMIALAVADVYAQVLHGPDMVGIIKTLPRWYATSEEGIPELKKEAVKKGEDIINESIQRNEVFDLEKLEFNSNIITSAETDTMVLSAASELIKILISGNQCIFLDSDVTESHQDTMEVYV